MSECSPAVLVADMLEAVERILAYTDGMGYAASCDDAKTTDAVLRNLQVLGDAADRVPKIVRAQAPAVEWTRSIRSRHILVHGYFGVDREIVWRIVEVHLPPLLSARCFARAQCRAVASGVVASGTVAVGQSVTGTFTQRVPGGAPAGTYRYAVNIGRFPSTVVAREVFTVEVTGAAAALGGWE